MANKETSTQSSISLRQVEHRLKKVQTRLLRLESFLGKTFNWRLGIGVTAFCLLTMSVIFKDLGLTTPLFLISLFSFSTFVYLGRKYKRSILIFKTYHSLLERIKKRQMGVPLDGGHERPSLNSVANDIDLFGPHSLLSFLDESLTEEALKKLIAEMEQPPTDIGTILRRQDRIKAMTNLSPSVLRWMVRSKPEQGRLSLLKLSQFDSTWPKGTLLLASVVNLAFLILIASIGLLYFDKINLETFSLIFFVFAMLSLTSATRLRDAFRMAMDFSQKFEPYLSYIKGFERFSKTPDSQAILPIMKKAKLAAEALSIQTHPLVLIFVNALVPWNQFFSIMLKKSFERLKGILPEFSNRAADFEFHAMLSLYRDFHKTTFPTFSESRLIQVKGLYHPLLKANERVANDFELNETHTLALVTGSNMSGKSTFLRTLGLNQTLAMMGAPVCADSMVTHLAPVQSSIRISDTLSEKTSYFYAEVLRIKAIIEFIKTGKPCLVLIDEIFKGTNNEERRTGAQGLIEYLLKSKNLSLVTTHDLDLTEMGQKNSGILNFHFNEDLVSGIYEFSYKIRSGPSPSTNAVKIMRDAGLPV